MYICFLSAWSDIYPSLCYYNVIVYVIVQVTVSCSHSLVGYDVILKMI